VQSPEAQVRFSIVVPAYNEADFLAPTLQSLQAQDFDGAYEIVVVDNNSTDATVEIARGFGVRVAEQPQQGICQARQRGLEAARGEIVISVDADTIYPSDWLSRIDAAFRSRPDVVGVGGPCRFRDPPWWIALFSATLFWTVRLVFRLTGWVGYLTATNAAFRKAAFSGYDLNLTQGGDELDLVRRLRRRGRVVWDRQNVVLTSPRRQDQGLFRTIFVSFLFFYLGAYLVNRVTSRRLLGMAPVFRAERRRRHQRFRWRLALTAVVVITTGVGVLGYLTER